VAKRRSEKEVATATEVATKEREMRPSPLVAGLHLFDPVLVDCHLDWSPQDNESPKKEDLERFYDCAIQFVERSPKLKTTIASCAFTAGQRTKEKKHVFEVRSQYMVAVNHDGGFDALSQPDRKKLLEAVARTSAWPLFRALFANMVSQTFVDLPLLSSIPNLRWTQPGEDESKEQQEEEKKPA